uniref:Uncharacterized protein n=1 Tax=Ananas comosus var. bracteatus TaxID=296719 RepID=A0A6V7PNR9_ANACO|nr:unnamed protein product [Ananas comosus var. bracteatus]
MQLGANGDPNFIGMAAASIKMNTKVSGEGDRMVPHRGRLRRLRISRHRRLRTNRVPLELQQNSWSVGVCVWYGCSTCCCCLCERVQWQPICFQSAMPRYSQSAKPTPVGDHSVSLT